MGAVWSWLAADASPAEDLPPALPPGRGTVISVYFRSFTLKSHTLHKYLESSTFAAALRTWLAAGRAEHLQGDPLEARPGAAKLVSDTSACVEIHLLTTLGWSNVDDLAAGVLACMRERCTSPEPFAATVTHVGI